MCLCVFAATDMKTIHSDFFTFDQSENSRRFKVRYLGYEVTNLYSCLQRICCVYVYVTHSSRVAEETSDLQLSSTQASRAGA